MASQPVKPSLRVQGQRLWWAHHRRVFCRLHLYSKVAFNLGLGKERPTRSLHSFNVPPYAIHLREFHATVLLEIECCRAQWGDSFSDLETRLSENLQGQRGLCTRSGAPVLFCQDFQHGKCGHSKDHYGTIRNETKWLQHNCAKCWAVSCVIAKHSEYSADCPTKNVVSGLTWDQRSYVTLPSWLATFCSQVATLAGL